jgi:hypothetical protein
VAKVGATARGDHRNHGCRRRVCHDGRTSETGSVSEPTRIDPKAIIESSGNVVQQVRGARQDFLIEAERQLTYEGGSTKLLGVKITVRNRGGRDYVVSGREAQAGRTRRICSSPAVLS